MTTRLDRRAVAAALVVVSLAAGGLTGCSGDTDEAAPTTEAPTTTTASTTSEATTTTTGAPTTTEAPEPDCDPAALLAIADETLELARFAPGGPWDTDTTGAPFLDRTREPAEVARFLGLDCSVRAVQRADAGDRLLVGAWTGPRYGLVIQASDPPSTPFTPAARFDLLIERPYGEWIVDQEVWAATMDLGGSVVLRFGDTSSGMVAKSWQADIPLPGDAPVTLDSERHALAVLADVGARNLGIAHPPEPGSEVGMVQAITPTGQPVIAYVAPPGWIDPMTWWLDGPSRVETIEGVEVRLSNTGPDAATSAPHPDYGWIVDAGWSCGGYDWTMESGFGTVDELADFVATILERADC